VVGKTLSGAKKVGVRVKKKKSKKEGTSASSGEEKQKKGGRGQETYLSHGKEKNGVFRGWGGENGRNPRKKKNRTVVVNEGGHREGVIQHEKKKDIRGKKKKRREKHSTKKQALKRTAPGTPGKRSRLDNNEAQQVPKQ